jgi:hypothetical protein
VLNGLVDTNYQQGTAATMAYKDIVFKNNGDAPVKAEQAMIDASMDDTSSSPGPGGTRRAGNLWTSEARDDMYQRRENGESWEDICKVSCNVGDGCQI